MGGRTRLVVVIAFAGACSRAARIGARGVVDVGRVATAPPAVEALPDPEREWHTWSPPATAGGPFYPVVAMKPALSMGGLPYSPGVCELAILPGASFVTCRSSAARIDGARLDLAFAQSAPGGEGLQDLQGRYPEDLWARGFNPDARRGTSDAFDSSWTRWLRFTDGTWTVFPTSSSERMPFVGGATAIPMLPAPETPVDRSAPGCADYRCARILPRFLVTEGAPRPDFSALKDRIAWVHETRPEHDDARMPDPALDFAFAVDPEGPVHVVMRALDLTTGRVAWGLARWTPAGGATFHWLPPPLDTLAKADPHRLEARRGRLSFQLWAPQSSRSYAIAFDGRAWEKPRVLQEFEVERPGWEPGVKLPPAVGVPSEYRNSGGVVVRLVDGTEQQVPPFGHDDDDMAALTVTSLSRDDVFVSTRKGLWRTVQPPELLYRTETFGPIHPWPADAGDDCTHPFVIFDATEEAKQQYARPYWSDAPADLPMVEMRIFGHVVIGAAAPNMKLARAWLEQWHPESRMSQQPPLQVVCARPINAKPLSRK